VYFLKILPHKGISKKGRAMKLLYFLKMTPHRGGIERNKDGLPALIFEYEPVGQIEKNNGIIF
jgi:hypothetical protein